MKLTKIVESDPKINTVLISGIDSVFSEEDNTKKDVDNLQFLIASILREIAADKKNGITYTIVSSNKCCPHLLDKADTAIKLYQEGKKEKAMLTKHYARQFATIEL